MSAPAESPVELDFYLSDRAWEAAKTAGVIALDYHPEELQGALDFVEEESGKTLDEPLAQTGFVIMRGDFNPRRSDAHFFRAPLDSAYVGAASLATSEVPAADRLQKQDILEASGNKSILEVRPSPDRFHGNITPAIARVVLGPRPEEAQLAAGLGAWLNQVVDAFTLSDRKKQTIQDEVARRFPSAVVLRRATDPRR